jgi:hypothetical protein
MVTALASGERGMAVHTSPINPRIVGRGPRGLEQRSGLNFRPAAPAAHRQGGEARALDEELARLRAAYRKASPAQRVALQAPKRRAKERRAILRQEINPLKRRVLHRLELRVAVVVHRQRRLLAIDARRLRQRIGDHRFVGLGSPSH